VVLVLAEGASHLVAIVWIMFGNTIRKPQTREKTTRISCPEKNIEI
jgi:hypothetical protein